MPTFLTDRFFNRMVAACLGLATSFFVVAPVFSQIESTPPVNAGAQGPHGAVNVMFDRPYIPEAQLQLRFPARCKPLWIAALDRPDVETRRLAVEAIALAHVKKMDDFSEVFPKFRQMLEAKILHPILRRALVTSLIQVDDRSSASVLWRVASEPDVEADLIEHIDNALAAWGYTSASSGWLKRAQASEIVPLLRVSAVNALAKVGDQGAAAVMKEMIASSAESSLRQAAATALGTLQPKGLESLASSLAKGTWQDRLCAAAVLQHHDTAAAIDILRLLSQDDEPAVAALALDRLFALGAHTVSLDLAVKLQPNMDARVRERVAQILAGHETSASTQALLAMCNDSNPSLRAKVRELIIELAEKSSDLRGLIIDGTMNFLAQEDWRSIEQAGFILGALNHKPAATRMVAFLRHQRQAVRLAACSALSRLEVPETLAPALQRAEELTELAFNLETLKQDERLGDEGLFGSRYFWGDELTQLFQFFGIMRYTPAEPLMKKYIPKAGRPGLSRAAAIWAIGLFHENKPDEDLTQTLADRLSDVYGSSPEDPNVRMMSAIGIGRMKDDRGMPTLEEFYKRDNSSKHIGGSCRWAIIQITGKQLPPLSPIVRRSEDWFLVPID